MKKTLLLLLLGTSVLITGCLNPNKTKEAMAMRTAMPYRDASMMDNSVTKYNISVAATPVEKEMQENIFANDIEDGGFVPLLVTITNNANQDVLVRGQETLLIFGDNSTTQADGDLVKKTFRDKAYVMPGINEPVPRVDNRLVMIKEAVNTNFFKKSLREDIVHSGQSLTGFVFYDKAKWPTGDKKLRIVFQTLRKLNYFVIDVPIDYTPKKKVVPVKKDSER